MVLPWLWVAVRLRRYVATDALAWLAASGGLLLLLFVVPVMQEVYADIGAELPWSTVLVINLSNVTSGPVGPAVLALALLLSCAMIGTTPARERPWSLEVYLGVSGLACLVVLVALVLPLTATIESHGPTRTMRDHLRRACEVAARRLVGRE